MYRWIRHCEKIALKQQQQQRRLFATTRKTPLCLLGTTTAPFHHRNYHDINGSWKHRGTPLLVSFPCGDADSLYSCHQTRYFSAASPPDVVQEDENMSNTAATKAIAQRRERLKSQQGAIKDMMRHDLMQQQQERHPEAAAFVLPKYQPDDFVRLFDSTVPKYSLAQVDELLKNLDQAVKDTTATSASKSALVETLPLPLSNKPKRVRRKSKKALK